jgi:putative addiction module antidote
MPETLKVRKIGGSLGFIVPKSLADEMMLREGDELYANGTADGITLTPYDPDFADALDASMAFMHAKRNAFRELAK